MYFNIHVTDFPLETVKVEYYWLKNQSIAGNQLVPLQNIKLIMGYRGAMAQGGIHWYVICFRIRGSVVQTLIKTETGLN